MSAVARAILAGNDRDGYTVPNSRVYPFQWNWDSALVALGFAAFDLDRAWREVETLFKAQWPDGFVPHIVFWADDDGYFPGPAEWATGTNPPTSGITQPPLAATVVRKLWEQSDRVAFRPRLAALLPKLLAWHRWFARVRDPCGNGLAIAVHPWETGRDNSPEWDAAAAAVDTTQLGPYQRRDTSHLHQSMRPTQADYDRYVALLRFGRRAAWDHAHIGRASPFRVADIGLSMILLRANRDLLVLAQELGEAGAAAELGERIARSERGADWLWDAELDCYCSRDTITGAFSKRVTSASFLAFYAGLSHEPRDQRLLDHLERIAQKVQYLVPSLDPDDEAFDSMRYWRGPVWAVVNFLIATGLADAGHERWAQRVRSDTRKLIEGAGFYEAFCPVTGRGTGGSDFSWTAAMWLHWAAPFAPR